MTFLSALIKAAPKVFVWVSFSDKNSAYILVSKTALHEYISSLNENDSTDGFYVEILDNGELYLGHPPPEEEI